MIRFRMQPQPPAQPKPNAAPELLLKDGRRVTIRSAEEKDAHALAALFRRTERESVYLSREPANGFSIARRSRSRSFAPIGIRGSAR